jgi:hypothetical protein
VPVSDVFAKNSSLQQRTAFKSAQQHRPGGPVAGLQFAVDSGLNGQKQASHERRCFRKIRRETDDMRAPYGL